MRDPKEVSWIVDALIDMNEALSKKSLGIRFAYDQVIEIYTAQDTAVRVDFEDGKIGVADHG